MYATSLNDITKLADSALAFQ